MPSRTPRVRPADGRNAAVPVAGFGSNASFLLIFLGMIFQPLRFWSWWASAVRLRGLLPVGQPAGGVQRQQPGQGRVGRTGITNQQQLVYVDKVLSAAAWTYVAATLQAALTLLYYIMLFTAAAGIEGGARGEGEEENDGGVSSYRDLNVWKTAMGLARDVYGLTRTSRPRGLGIRSQIQRAVVSIPANIAEGHARSSTRSSCTIFPLPGLTRKAGDVADAGGGAEVLSAGRDRRRSWSVRGVSRMLSGLRRRLKERIAGNG